MEADRSQGPPSPKGPPEASRPREPSGPPGAPCTLRSLVKSTRAQSLRERWNTLKLQGFRGPPPSDAQASPLKTQQRSLRTGQRTPRTRPVGGPSRGPSIAVGASSPPRRVVSFLLAKKQSGEATEASRPREETGKEELLQKHKNFGKVPKYLRVLREALLERQRNEQLAAQKETLAAGVRRVCEREKEQLLSILLQQKEKAEKELSGLPIALKTERQRLRSDELERLLVSLEKQLLKVSSTDLFVEKGDGSETLPRAASIPARTGAFFSFCCCPAPAAAADAAAAVLQLLLPRAPFWLQQLRLTEGASRLVWADATKSPSSAAASAPADEAARSRAVAPFRSPTVCGFRV
ncbi:hypothetical protein Esti_002239 [Eimeria stiedai]